MQSLDKHMTEINKKLEHLSLLKSNFYEEFVKCVKLHEEILE